MPKKRLADSDSDSDDEVLPPPKTSDREEAAKEGSKAVRDDSEDEDSDMFGF